MFEPAITPVTASAAAPALMAGAFQVSSGQAQPAGAEPALAPWQVRQVMAHIDAHLERPLRIEDLASIARLSASHFAHAFRRSFGMPPYAYILVCRIERAAVMLASTDEPLAEIAMCCGMTDQAHLSRLFKQMKGETPSRWRRRHAAFVLGANASRRSADYADGASDASISAKTSRASRKASTPAGMPA